MFNLSSSIASSQQSPHKNLRHKLRIYRNTNYRNSIPNYAKDAFNRFAQVLDNENVHIILDSGCGTGESSIHLARENPHCLVVGVDKSVSRLQRCQSKKTDVKNIIYVRFDLIHFWRLLQQAQQMD